MRANDGRVGYTCEIGREGFCDAVRELLVGFCLPQIGERQHNDRERGSRARAGRHVFSVVCVAAPLQRVNTDWLRDIFQRDAAFVDDGYGYLIADLMEGVF